MSPRVLTVLAAAAVAGCALWDPGVPAAAVAGLALVTLLLAADTARSPGGLRARLPYLAAAAGCTVVTAAALALPAASSALAVVAGLAALVAVAVLF